MRSECMGGPLTDSEQALGRTVPTKGVSDWVLCLPGGDVIYRKSYILLPDSS